MGGSYDGVEERKRPAILGKMNIACLCPTFQRVEVLEESLWCFLQQTHDGEKGLYICNDDPNVRLIFDHPEVRIENRQVRFNTIFEKRNHMVNNLDECFMILWDDDDIHASWAIDVSVKYKIKSGKEWVCLSPWYKGTPKSNRMFDYPSELFACSMIDSTSWVGIGGIEEQKENNWLCEEEFLKKFRDANMHEIMKIEKDEVFYLWRKTGFRDTWKRSPPNDYKFLPERKVEDIYLNPHLNPTSRFFGYK